MAALFVGLATASAQVFVAPAPLAAPGDDLGFYLGADLGPSFVPDFQSSRFGFPASFSTRPGFRFGVEPGYNFLATAALTLGAEFETGFIANDLNSATGPGFPEDVRGHYYQVPFLGSLVLKLQPASFVVPYIGVGGGGDYSSVRVHSRGFFGFENHSDETDPAAQAMAGVRFRLNAFSDLGLGYKFLAAFPDEGRNIETHAVEAVFTVKF